MEHIIYSFICLLKMKCKLIFKRDTANMLNETRTTILNKRNVSLYVKHFKYAKNQMFQKPWELPG